MSPHAFPRETIRVCVGGLFIDGRVGYLRENAISSAIYAFLRRRQLPPSYVGFRNFRCFAGGGPPRVSAGEIAACTSY